MKKTFGTYVRDGETRVPLNADEEKTLIWAGWRPEGEEPRKARKVSSPEELPTYDSPPQVPDGAGGSK